MHTVQFSDAQSDLNAVIEQAIESHGSVLIQCSDGRNAVIMSQAQYDSWMETMHLLSSPANAVRLLRSIEQHRAWANRSNTVPDPHRG